MGKGRRQREFEGRVTDREVEGKRRKRGKGRKLREREEGRVGKIEGW